MRRIRIIIMIVVLTGLELNADSNDFLYMQDAIAKLIKLEQQSDVKLKSLFETQNKLTSEMMFLKEEISLIKNGRNLLDIKQRLDLLEDGLNESKALSSSALSLAQKNNIIKVENKDKFIGNGDDILDSSTIVSTQFKPTTTILKEKSKKDKKTSILTTSSGIVSANSVTIWSTPDMDTGSMVGELKKGVAVEISGYIMGDNGIGWVKLANNKGYVLYGLITELEEIR